VCAISLAHTAMPPSQPPGPKTSRTMDRTLIL